MQIFDSLLHPTVSGKWFNRSVDASFETLGEELKANDFIGGCAVGLWGVEGYEHQAFLESCKKNPVLVPVAGFSPKASDNISQEITDLAQMGFKALKIHSRFSNLDLEKDNELIADVFRLAHQNGLAVFLCTYMSCAIEQFPSRDPYWSIVKILKAAPETRVILLHGGVTNVLQYAELVRFNKHLLLDFSYTMIKYQGSSVEQDIKYLFRTLDQRICIGTDHPEYALADTVKAFETLTEGLPEEKKLNIAHKNILSFFEKQ